MATGKRRLNNYNMKEQEQEDDVDEEQLGFGRVHFNYKKNKSSSNHLNLGSVAGASATCQADNCNFDLSASKRYHRRHKVCEFHAKAPVVSVAGTHQRFCQQCSRFHGLEEFDESKRSCRKRLAGHNQRRRKSSSDVHGESST